MRIAFFHPYYGDGGVERGIVLLARRFRELGVETDVVTFRPKVALADGEIPGLRFIDLGTSRAALSVLSLRQYLAQTRPGCVIGAQSYANVIAATANLLDGRRTRLIVTERVAVSKERIEYPGWMRFGRLKSRAILALMRLAYPWSDLVAANSADGAADLEATLGMPRRSVAVLYNPTFDPEIKAKAAARTDHPWFDAKTKPVIVAMGRLNRQKDFGTLLEAFYRVREAVDCRLAILGEGDEREALERRAAELGVADSVAFLGFRSNPYAYLARSDLFVLSSLYEGLPNALIEAVALGVPAVSTNCLSGPREILLDGAGGRLVGVGDTEALARAMVSALRDKAESQAMAARAAEALSRFDSASAAARYLEVCLPEGGGTGSVGGRARPWKAVAA